MEYLALLMTPGCSLVGREFRFDAGHERGYWNWILAMKA